jgi:hypothetical protein
LSYSCFGTRVPTANKAERRRAIVHAGVVNFRVRAGRMGEAVRTYVGSVIPALREERGFRGVLVLPPKLHNRRVPILRPADR